MKNLIRQKGVMLPVYYHVLVTWMYSFNDDVNQKVATF